MNKKTVCFKKNDKLIPQSCEGDYTDLMPVYSDSMYGKLVLQNSMIMVVKSIMNSMFPESELNVEHTINGGLYCEIFSSVLISEPAIGEMNEKLQESIRQDEKLYVKFKTREELVGLFADEKKKSNLLRESSISGAFFAQYNSVKDFFFTPVVMSTGSLDGAFIKYYPPGIIIYSGKEFEKSDQKKLFNVFNESENWAKILNWRSVDNLNESIDRKEISELIQVSEALHEKKIVDIANQINSHRGRLKLITIAGPSSSGKTTFLKRLSIQLRVLGISVSGISLDDYFVNRENTPRDENNQLDYESIDAIDLDLFNRHLVELIDYREVELPVFDFASGVRKKETKKAKLDKNTILIIEGIHGLNDKLTRSVAKENKAKIYVSALTQINTDSTHRISTTDNRLIRRMVRDYLFRNHSADKTLDMWRSVRRGEEKNIFPFQETADFMFNSSLLYELSVLKSYAEPLLAEITDDKPYYLDAKRLEFILSFFKPVSMESIPPTSVLREFIGNSSFKY
ncbi:MAG: nucleoside kinase [bacterium]|nr:nucleoside kinase [bacterium]